MLLVIPFEIFIEILAILKVLNIRVYSNNFLFFTGERERERERESERERERKNIWGLDHLSILDNKIAQPFYTFLKQWLVLKQFDYLLFSPNYNCLSNVIYFLSELLKH